VRAADTLLNIQFRRKSPTYLRERLNIYESYGGCSRINCSSEIPSKRKVGVNYTIRGFIIVKLHQILIEQSYQEI
jgi:hypothetical protein